jgi:hypothetical protein
MSSGRLTDPQRGTVIDGKFLVVRTLGAGGMGVVLEAQHLSLGGKLAIKVLRVDAAQNEDAARRFSQEAQIASRLQSEHVVRVFDLGRTPDGEPYIVMELLAGEDLAAVLARESPLDVARSIDLVLQACLGVAAAHAEGLVHRDLKPANLFLATLPDRTKIVKVLDFGLSKNTAQSSPALTASTSSFGTPQYMSPEQVMSTKNVDHRSDQHALAMVLYELLTGRPPYQGETSAAVTVLIVTAPPPSARALRRQVPARLDEIIRQALAKKPDDRFEDLGAFACAIAPFGGPEAVRMAARVQQMLTARPRGAVQGRSTLDAEDPSTVPVGHRGPDSEIVTAVLPSEPDRVGFRTRLVTAMAVASVATALAIVGVVTYRGARASSETSPVAASAPAFTDPAVAEPAVVAPASVPSAVPRAASSAIPEADPPAVAPAVTDDVVETAEPASSASAVEPKKAPPARSPGTRGPRSAKTAPASDDPGDIFGASRKGGGR